MSLLDCCDVQFARKAQICGDQLYLNDDVYIERTRSRTLRAEVCGRRSDDVQLDWSRASLGTVTVSCTCSQFAEGNFCEHIWATIRQAEYEDLLPTSFGRSYGRVMLVGDRSGPRRANGSVANWERILNHALDADEQALISAARPFASAQLRRAWFSLNVGATIGGGRELVIDLFQQETKKDGQFGKIKKLSLSRDEIEQFSDPLDRELLELLVGGAATAVEYTSYYAYYSAPKISRLKLTASLCRTLLPRLCQTERFLWILDDSQAIEEARPLSWGGDSAWRFGLNVSADESDQQWRCRAEYRCGQLSCTSKDLVLVTAGGVGLFHRPAEPADPIGVIDFQGSPHWAVALHREGEIRVPFQHRPQLLNHLLGFTDNSALSLPENLQVEHFAGPPQPKLEVLSPTVMGQGSELVGRVGFVYGEEVFTVEDPALGRFDTQTNRMIRRDQQAESDRVSQLWRLGMRPWTQSTRPVSEVRFPAKQLADNVAALVAQGWLVEAEGRLIRRPGQYKLSVTSKVDWFELSGEFDFDGQTASLPDLLKALKKGEKYVILDDGTQGMLPEEWLAQYGSMAELADVEGDVLRFTNSQATLLDALLASQPHVQVDQRFDEFRQKLRSFDGVAPQSPPKTFAGRLRDYQQEGLGWLGFLQEFGLGGCLADDMGLGKTIQVLALLEARRRRRRTEADSQRKPSLVVVPRSLVFNWIEEARRFTPRLRMLNYTGLDRQQRLEQSSGFDCLITTYGTLRRDVLPLKEMRFDYAILDEAQAIKNSGSQAAKACRLVQADHRLVMTGTPVENHLDDLWSLFEFLNPGMLGHSSTFQSITRRWKDDPSSVQLLGRALRPFVLRRTKEQVLSDLPEKTEQTLYCEMGREQRKLYDALRVYYRDSLSQRVKQKGIQQSKIHVLEALLRLRQAACHPGLLDKKRVTQPSAKLDVLLEQVKEITEEGHKALVFSQFTSLLAIVRQQLDQAGISYEYLDGRTRQRQAKVERFQNDPDCHLFLISLKAGGYGLNLTAADYVFMLDPWWNPAVEAQAIDRTHRIGQTRPVFAYRLICKDTVEEKIILLQQDKRQLADAIVSADNNLIRNLTAEDLQLLLG